MSVLAFQILLILLHARSYLASWNIAKELEAQNGQDYAYEFRWRYPESPLDYAVKELIDKELVEEMADLGSRYRIVYTSDR